MPLKADIIFALCAFVIGIGCLYTGYAARSQLRRDAAEKPSLGVSSLNFPDGASGSASRRPGLFARKEPA